MLIRIRASGQIMTGEQFCNALRTGEYKLSEDDGATSIEPSFLTAETLDHFGADPVFEGPQPTGEPWQSAVSDGVEQVDGMWRTKYKLAPDTEPPEWLDTLKGRRVEAVRSLVADKLAVGAPMALGGVTLHIALDDGSRADMGAMATTAIAVQVTAGAVPWPESYQAGWITIENIRIPLPTPTDGLGLAASVGDLYAKIRQRGRDLKDAILSAADETALAAIDIDSGWPG